MVLTVGVTRRTLDEQADSRIEVAAAGQHNGGTTFKNPDPHRPLSLQREISCLLVVMGWTPRGLVGDREEDTADLSEEAMFLDI